MTVIKGAVAAAALAVAAVAGAGTAGADPMPSPGPGYQIPGSSGPEFPGVQQYPPRCLRAMLACGFHYDPGTATWTRSDPGDV
jgi:hypothetical protein